MHIYTMTIILTLACNDFHYKKYKIEFWLFNLNTFFFNFNHHKCKFFKVMINDLLFYNILFVFFTHSYVVT